jgi:hypothetical protein
MTHPMIHTHLMRNSFPALGAQSVDGGAGLE